jgi:hypothetical protein
MKEHWQKFYESAWEYRAEVIKRLIADGETDPRRIIALQENSEKSFWLRYDNDTIEPVPDAQNPYNFPMLPTDVPLYRAVSVDGKFLKIPNYANIIDFLTDYIRDRSFDAIIELGCGLGQNLVKLYYSGGPKSIPYYAGEFAQSGVEAAHVIASLCNDFSLVPFPFDHCAPDLSPIEETGNILIFTSHSIEHVMEIPGNYFNLLAEHATSVTGLHFEPFGFQLSDNSDDVSKAQKSQAIARGWNTNCPLMAEAVEKVGSGARFSVRI